MLEGNNFDQKLLETIRENKMEPKPKWQFIAKDYAIWGAGLCLLIVGAMAISIVIYVVRFDDWSAYRKMGTSVSDLILIAIPFFWLIFLAVFVSAVSLDFKKTKKGYRHSTWLIFAGTIASSAFLGTILYFAGVGEMLDDTIGQRAPLYDQVINPHIHFWASPENGRLSGLVSAQNGADEFIVIDSLRKEWKVDTTEVDKSHIGAMQIGKPVEIIGEIISSQAFKAQEVLPLRAGKGFYNRIKPRSQRMPGVKNGDNGARESLEVFSMPDRKYQEI